MKRGLLVRPRIRQRVAEPSSGTCAGLIQTVRGGRTIAPALNCDYGPRRLREQKVAVPVPDGEIASACERSSRTQNLVTFEGPSCLSWPLECEFASGTHPPAQCGLWSLRADSSGSTSFIPRLFSAAGIWNGEHWPEDLPVQATCPVGKASDRFGWG